MDPFVWDPERQAWTSQDGAVRVHRLVCGKWVARKDHVNIAYARSPERAFEKAENLLRDKEK